MSYAGAIIQARVGSSRLPCKVLEAIEGRSMLGWVVARLKRSRCLERIVLAIPDDEENTPLIHHARQLGISVWAGPEQDVLARYCGAAEQFEIDPIVRVTSDCPLIDPELVDAVVDHYRQLGAEGIDLVSNTLPRRWPRGLDVEVFSAAALARAAAEEKEMSVREHVTLVIYRNNQMFQTAGLAGPEDLSHHRWTVDTREDLEFIRAVYRGLGERALECGVRDVLELLAAQPQLGFINSEITQKELPK